MHRLFRPLPFLILVTVLAVVNTVKLAALIPYERQNAVNWSAGVAYRTLGYAEGEFSILAPEFRLEAAEANTSVARW